MRKENIYIRYKAYLKRRKNNTTIQQEPAKSQDDNIYFQSTIVENVCLNIQAKINTNE